MVSGGGIGDIESEDSDVMEDGPCAFADTIADGFLNSDCLFEALFVSGGFGSGDGGAEWLVRDGCFPGDGGSVLEFAVDSAAFDFEEVAESGGVEAAEPGAEGAGGVVVEGAESAGEFAPEELDEFLGVSGVTQLGSCPGFEEGVVVGEEALPRGVIAPGMQPLDQGAAGHGSVFEWQ